MEIEPNIIPIGYRVRSFEMKRDFVMVNQWSRAHGRDGLPAAYLPPDGIILTLQGEPIAAGWLYKSLGVGVAFLEHVHTRPGLTPKQAREAIAVLVTYFRDNAKADNYGVLLAHTYLAMARCAKRDGWHVLGEDRVAIGIETGLELCEERGAA